MTSLKVHMNAPIIVTTTMISRLITFNNTLSADLLVGNLLALLTDNVLAIKIEISGSGVGMVLTVSLDVFNHLGETEEVVHLLERQTLGLGNEEPDKEEHGETERAVNQESTI